MLKEGESATEHEVLTYAHEKLASFKTPKRVVFASAAQEPQRQLLKRQLRDAYAGLFK